MKVTKKSFFSKKTRTLDLDITQEQVDKWNNGMLIQQAFPNLTPSQREFLMTGAWDDEWDEAFPPELDDEGFIDKLYAVDPKVNHAEEHDRLPTVEQMEEEDRMEAATLEVGMRLEDVSQDVKDKMTTTVFRSILRVADLGETND